MIADGALVTALLKMIYGAQVAPFTGLNLPPYAATGVTAVSKFAADAKSADWLCSAGCVRLRKRWCNPLSGLSTQQA